MEWRFFWGKQVTRRYDEEDLEEPQMGHGIDDNHRIGNYQYRQFSEEKRKRTGGSDSDEARELRVWAETLSEENGKLLTENRALSSEAEALRAQVEELSITNRALSSEAEYLRAQVKSLRAQVKSLQKTEAPEAPSKDGRAASLRTDKPNPAQGEFVPKEGPKASDVLFHENAGSCDYERRLRKFEDEAAKLKRSAEGRLSANGGEKASFLNLIDKCARDFAALRKKSPDADAGDLAEESAKILKKTVCKALAKRELKFRIEEYLENCGVKKLEWREGKKLNDNEYAYLEEPVFYDDVTTPRQDGVITKIERESYYIAYEEDGRIRMALIPGTYHIGKYRGAGTYPRA